MTPSAADLAAALGVKNGRGICPVHGGGSFTLREKNGKPVWKCWGGCSQSEILAELRRRGLWPERDETPEQREARRRAWIERRRALEEAEDWQRAALSEAEHWQTTCLNLAEREGTAQTWLAWIRAAHDTYSIRRPEGDALLRRLQYEHQVRPQLTRRLIAAGRADRQETERICEIAAAIIWAAALKDKGVAA